MADTIDLSAKILIVAYIRPISDIFITCCSTSIFTKKRYNWHAGNKLDQTFNFMNDFHVSLS